MKTEYIPNNHVNLRYNIQVMLRSDLCGGDMGNSSAPS